VVLEIRGGGAAEAPCPFAPGVATVTPADAAYKTAPPPACALPLLGSGSALRHSALSPRVRDLTFVA